jgi:hypothetical protein
MSHIRNIPLASMFSNECTLKLKIEYTDLVTDLWKGTEKEYGISWHVNQYIKQGWTIDEIDINDQTVNFSLIYFEEDFSEYYEEPVKKSKNKKKKKK